MDEETMRRERRSQKVISSLRAAPRMRCCNDRAMPEATLQDSIDAVMESRKNVVMVRVNDDASAKLNELVEAGIVDSRSEAAAFLISEGIGATGPLFDQISEKTRLIRETKEELRRLLDE